MKKSHHESPPNVFDILDHDCLVYLVDQISSTDMFPLALACKAMYPICSEKKVYGRWTTSYSDSPSRLVWARHLPVYARPEFSYNLLLTPGCMAYACSHGLLDTLEYALKHDMIWLPSKTRGFDWSYVNAHYKSVIEDGTPYYRSPIHSAAQFGRTEVVEWLLNNKVDFVDSPVLCNPPSDSAMDDFWEDKRRDSCANAVCVAAEHGHLSTMEYLLGKGGCQFAGNGGAMLAAARGGQLHVMDWLIRRATTNLYIYNPLKQGCSWSQVVREIMASGPTLEKLKWMCERFVCTGKFTCTVALRNCPRRANNDLLDQHYKCMLAVIRHNLWSSGIDMFKWMLEHGYSIHDSKSLFELAVRNDDIECLKWLMSLEAPKKDLLAYSVDCGTKTTKCLQYLISTGVDLSSISGALDFAIDLKNYSAGLVLYENAVGRQMNFADHFCVEILTEFVNEARRRKLHEMMDSVLCRSPAKFQEIETLLCRV